MRKRTRIGGSRGFTLVELLVAIVLIDVGLLALVAGAAVVVRRVNDFRSRTGAIHAASTRLELLALTPCAAITGFAGTSPDLREHWSIALLPNAVRELSDSIAYTVTAGQRTFTLRTKLPC